MPESGNFLSILSSCHPKLLTATLWKPEAMAAHSLENKVFIYETFINYLLKNYTKNAIKFTFKRREVFPKSEIKEELIT